MVKIITHLRTPFPFLLPPCPSFPPTHHQSTFVFLSSIFLSLFPSRFLSIFSVNPSLPLSVVRPFERWPQKLHLKLLVPFSLGGGQMQLYQQLLSHRTPTQETWQPLLRRHFLISHFLHHHHPHQPYPYPQVSCSSSSTFRFFVLNRLAVSVSEPVVDENLFRYTSGRWLYNEEEQMAQRYIKFDVGALHRVIFDVCGSPVIGMEKKEGLFNKSFMCSLANGQMVTARIKVSSYDSFVVV